MRAPGAAGLNGMAAPRARVEIGRHGVRYEGPLLGVGAHSASVACIVEALEGRLEIGLRGSRLVARAAHVPAGVVHELRASSDARLAFWYFEPGVLDWPELARARVVALGVGRRRWLRSPSARATLLGGASERARAGSLDGRVARTLRELEQHRELDMDALAARCGLSASRLRHLFVAEIGVPLSRYRWWLRLRCAARALGAGASLARAAHDAGFSDAAHFSRTFRRTFGFAPSLLLARADIR